jgi:predicted DNA-binding transcriptional regulator AlpA
LTGEDLTFGSPGTRPTTDHQVRSHEQESSVMSNSNKPMRLIDRSEVESRVGFRRERIRQLELAGKFPRRIPMSTRRNLWIESEIDNWIRDHVAAARRPPDVRP